MGLLKAVRNSCNDIIEKSYSMGQYYGEVRKIKNENRQRLISTVHWTAGRSGRGRLFRGGRDGDPPSQDHGDA